MKLETFDGITIETNHILTFSRHATMKTISKQEKRFRKDTFVNGKPVTIIATVRHDDACKNGHNTFSIAGEIYELGYPLREGKVTHKSGAVLGLSSGGCMHSLIEEHIPLLAPFTKWHLTSTDGPIHCLDNTVYHVQRGHLEAARSSAVWPEATDDDFRLASLADRLKQRLPELMKQFQADVESLGFTY